MKTVMHVFGCAICILSVFSLLGCSNIFTKRDSGNSNDVVSISLDLSGIAGQTISRTAAIITSNFSVTVSVYDGTTVLDTQTAVMPLTGTSTLSFTNLTPGKTVTVQVELYNGTELIYKRAASVTLVEGENKIAFDGSSPVLLYTDYSGCTSPFVNYTAAYTSSGHVSLTGTPSTVLGTDFDASGNAYVLYTDATSYYIDTITISGKVSNIVTTASTDNSYPVEIAVDRTKEILYEFYGTYADSIYTISAINRYHLDGSADSTSYNSSFSVSDVYTPHATADNDVIYLYYYSSTATAAKLEKVTYNASAGWTEGTGATVTSTGIKFTQDSINIFVNLGSAVNIVVSADSERYSITGMITDMKYYNGYLWLLVNLYDNYSNLRFFSTGALLQYDPANIDSNTTAFVSYGASFDCDNNLSCRPGAQHLDSVTSDSVILSDDTSVLGFNGPRRIVALTPKNLYIADDGVYAQAGMVTGKSSYHAAYLMAQRNRIAGFDMTTSGLDMTSVNVEFDTYFSDTTEAGDTNYYYTAK